MRFRPAPEPLTILIALNCARQHSQVVNSVDLWSNKLHRKNPLWTYYNWMASFQSRRWLSFAAVRGRRAPRRIEESIKRKIPWRKSGNEEKKREPPPRLTSGPMTVSRCQWAWLRRRQRRRVQGRSTALRRESPLLFHAETSHLLCTALLPASRDILLRYYPLQPLLRLITNGFTFTDHAHQHVLIKSPWN